MTPNGIPEMGTIPQSLLPPLPKGKIETNLETGEQRFWISTPTGYLIYHPSANDDFECNFEESD
jgi:hypothetical protein